MEIKVTKKERLLSVRNEWAAGDYYLIHGRFYDDSKTYFYRFKFVLHIDLACDLWDGENDIPYDEALNDMIWAFLYSAGDDIENKTRLQMFFDDCNATIEKWNRSIKR